MPHVNVTTTSLPVITIPPNRWGVIMQNESDTPIRFGINRLVSDTDDANKGLLLPPADEDGNPGVFAIHFRTATVAEIQIHAMQVDAGDKALTYEVLSLPLA